MAGNCVRVDPPFVKFQNVQVGQVYKTAVTATNVGKTLKKIVIDGPVSKLFKFTSTSSAVVVAPGLHVSGLLEFTPEGEEEVRSSLEIQIDDADTMEIPLLVFPRTCSLLMDSVLDFGCIAASSQVIVKHHPIANQGSAPGMFQVQYSGDPSIRLTPVNGVIAAGATQWLKVELRTDASRQIDEKAVVKLQNRSTVVLSIKAQVVDQHLEIFDLQGSPLSCLWFGPVYFGTSCVENIVLRNNSPQACDWVCVFQEAAAGTEVGTDLQKSTGAALLDRMEKCSPALKDVSQVLVCVPKQGRLGPYAKTTVAFRFSPVYKSSYGEKPHIDSTRQQDYCLFLLFESVGGKHGFTHHTGNSSVELAVTGSGLPVSLVPNPSHRFDFLTCVSGQRVDLLCVLQNSCCQLPVNFSFRKLAYFSAKPSRGTIAPGKCQDVVLSFNARQLGTFKVLQKVDVLGYVLQQRGDNTTEDSPGLELHRFHSITLHLSAVCHSETTHPTPKLNSGITPAVTNPTGLHPHVRFRELARCRDMVRTAVLSADKTQLHKHSNESVQNTEEEEFLAFPNDRASSIRPASPHRQYRTIFTGVHRYRYVDTDYAFTEEEEEQRKKHGQIYADLIKQLKQTRLQKIKERQQQKGEDDVDIGIVPSQRLVPPKLSNKDLETSKISQTSSGSFKKACPEKKGSRLQDMTSTTSQVTSQILEVINTVPSTSQQVAECNRTLTAQELYQVVIGPLLVDYGEVCVQSVCVQTLEMINRLSVHVWVQLEVDCPELQGSSPISHVLPPWSRTKLPLTFQSNKLGEFYRPVSFSMNRQHPGQILVQARVVRVALELSSTLLVLHPTPFSLAQSGYRSSVTLRNHRNAAAEFTWQPVVTESGILFSIRPATGIVEAYKELDCEVVWHASFSSPAEGDFDLSIHEGITQRLHCIAKVGCTRVQLAENWVTFESVPLNMTSIKTAVLHNTGQNHAYYQVQDVCPLPGMEVSPSEGLVPAGGQAVLNIHFNPDSVIRFHTRIEIALRNMKSIELRVGGSVEPPNVDINVHHFHLFGVYDGSRRSAPFTLTNRSSAAARVSFDLTEWTDFSVQLPDQSAEQEPGVSVVEIQGNQEVNCFLVFSPTQVVSYGFDLPMMVNGVSFPPASPSPLPTLSSSFTSCSSKAGSRKTVVKLIPQPVPMATSSRLIQATVLHAPLRMSPSNLLFYVKPSDTQAGDYTETINLKAECEGHVCWGDVVQPSVCWWFDCTATAALTADGEGELCTVCPSSGSLGPGQSICSVVSVRPKGIRTVSGTVIKLTIPLFLGDKREEGLQPYRELSITIHHTPSITIHPPQILLTPVPLGSNTIATLTLLASGYPRGTQVSAEVCEVELDDGTKTQLVSVFFPQGNHIPAQDMDQRRHVGTNKQEANVASLICSVSFCSAIPLTCSTDIIFTDHLQNRFKVKICAVADNCVLTVWPYMASHRSDQQIVLKTGATAVEAVLQHYHTPGPASCPASSSSSTFDHNSLTNKTSGTDSFPDSDSGQASRDEQFSSNRDTPTNQGVPEFPVSNSEEGLYYQSVLLAVERWFSLFGWPSGPHPISVPHTLRRVASKIQTSHGHGRTFRVSQNKDSRSVVDMLVHLTGQQIPGIPHSQTFSKNLSQRTNQLVQHYQAMLIFLSAQGACLCYIKPEYLLDKQEFNHWCSLQLKQEECGIDYSSVNYESLSKRSWIDVLLQIYKVFVLCRVSAGGPNATLKQKDTDEIIPICSQPLASNVYSPWELQLLSWLNKHYESLRKNIWGTGDAPSARWIVNFDLDLTDGLVLAALLAGYCPYLICSHFKRMYTRPMGSEEILHNNITIVQALTTLCLNIDVHPTDLSDPNPVQMLMLCVHLFERLPQYLPLQTITLSGELHSTFTKQVRLKSSTSNPIKYQALLFGEHAHLFSLPDGCAVTVPAKTGTELTVQYRCSFLQPMEAALLLVSKSAFASTLAFNLKTQVSRVTPKKTVKCSSPCYKLNAIQLQITNPFKKEGEFRVVLVDSVVNPLESKKKQDSLIRQATSKTNPSVETMPDKSCEEETEGKCSDLNGEDSEFSCAVKSVFLKPGQTDTLRLHYLPFCPGSRYCSVLLVCSQVGDVVFLVKATAELPLPCPLTAKPSSNIDQRLNSSDVCVSVLSLSCKVGQVCEEVIRVPVINMAWEQALAIWGQHSMSADEHRRRLLTHTLHSSSVRAIAAARKFSKQQAHLMRDVDNSEGVEYSVEVSVPEYFTLPNTVTVPVKENIKIPWKNPADCGCVEIPLRFQADSVGHFTCQVVLRSSCDTRVYMLEAVVTSGGRSVHLDFNSPAHHSVTKDIPLYNETDQDWKMEAELCGEGFFGPKVLNVAAGTKACYVLTFHPATECIVTGKLSLHNDCDGTEHVFTLRGVGERPLPVDHVILHCTAGQTTHTQLDVPNYSQNKLTLKVETDLSVVSGPPYLEIKPGDVAPYTLTVSPWKRGKQTGFLSFGETGDGKGNAGSYEAYFSLEIICEPAAPLKVINAKCVIQSEVAIEIPISNPHEEPLNLDVFLEGDDLSGPKLISVPPRRTFTYKATFSPDKVGKSMSSVVFQSEMMGEFWYQLELYALPPPVIVLPQACCQLGKWTRITLPLVNPTAETVEIIVANSNPRNYTLEMDSGNTLILEPHSSSQLGVRFSPSSVGVGSHAAKITFSCPQLQKWSFALSGRGLNPESEEPVSISSVIGCNTSIIIPFTNPTELQAVLNITLTDVDPKVAPPAATDKKVFSVALSHTEGIQINAGASLDVPVVFAPASVEVQRAWLCISMRSLSNDCTYSTSSMRSDQDLSSICWIYPLRGIPLEVPGENPPLGLVRCEAGCQLEKKVDVLLSGCVLGNQDRKSQKVSQVMKEDFLCEVHSVCEEERFDVEHCLSAYIEAARRDPESGIITVTLQLVYSPLRPCRCSAVVLVQCVSSGTWEFPISLTATEPVFDDVIPIEADELDKTSAVSFRLTSTTRRPEPFTAAFLPGSSSEFTVAPASGMLPPVSSAGALITVSFTPSSYSKRHRARLTIKAADMKWTYEVRGRTPQNLPPICTTSVSGSSSVVRQANKR